MMFASDNVAAAPPEIMAALMRANDGPAMPYGADEITARVRARVSELFERECTVHLVATGTAANALSLACLCPPWGQVYAHRISHIEEDEACAPEFYTGGAKLRLLEGEHGKISPAELDRAIAFTARAGVHNPQLGPLSLTQATEAGAIYTPEEVAALAQRAHAKGQGVHMDGTRFANAVARLGCSPADLTWRAGVDILCLGATKSGALAAEAVILFDDAKGWEFEMRRKRGGHLFSKMRFVAAQMEAWLEDGLWLRLAAHANAMADRLAAGLAETGAAALRHPVEANMVFAALPRRAHVAAYAAGAKYYLWPGDQSIDGPGDEMVSARLACSWATTEDEIDALVATFRAAL